MNKSRKCIGVILTIALAVIALMGNGCKKPDNIHNKALDGNIQEVRAFIESGGDVNKRHSKSGGNVLSYAVVSGDPALVDYLISKGANVNELDKNGTTALHYAAREHHGKVIRQLVAAGANPNIFAENYDTDNYGTTYEFPYKGAPLHWAIYRKGKSATQKEAAIKVLLDVGSDVNATGSLFLSPLDLAVLHCDIAIVRALIAAKADVNSSFALFYAAKKDDLKVARLLIDNGADVNKGGRNTKRFISDPLRKVKTALSVTKSKEMRALLIEAGARE